MSVFPCIGARANKRKKGRRRDEEAIQEEDEETGADAVAIDPESAVPPQKGPTRSKRRRVKDMQV